MKEQHCVCGMPSCVLFLTNVLQEASKVPGWSNCVCHRRLVHFTTVRVSVRCVYQFVQAFRCVGVNQYPGQRQYSIVFNDTHLSSHCDMHAFSMSSCVFVQLQTMTKIWGLVPIFFPIMLSHSACGAFLLRALPLLYYLTQNALDLCDNNCFNQITNHPS